MTYTADSDAIREMVAAYEENRNLAHGRGPSGYRVVVVDRRKYLAIDEVPTFEGRDCPGQGGRFLVDKATGVVYTIKGYGQRGWRIGTVEGLTAKYREGSATFRPDAPGHTEGAYDRAARWPAPKGGAAAAPARLRLLRGGMA